MLRLGILLLLSTSALAQDHGRTRNLRWPREAVVSHAITAGKWKAWVQRIDLGYRALRFDYRIHRRGPDGKAEQIGFRMSGWPAPQIALNENGWLVVGSFRGLGVTLHVPGKPGVAIPGISIGQGSRIDADGLLSVRHMKEIAWVPVAKSGDALDTKRKIVLAKGGERATFHRPCSMRAGDRLFVACVMGTRLRVMHLDLKTKKQVELLSELIKPGAKFELVSVEKDKLKLTLAGDARRIQLP